MQTKKEKTFSFRIENLYGDLLEERAKELFPTKKKPISDYLRTLIINDLNPMICTN